MVVGGNATKPDCGDGQWLLQINFLLVRIKIKHMEIAIIRRETAGSGTNQYNESETMVKYEVMDGAPVKGEPASMMPSVPP